MATKKRLPYNVTRLDDYRVTLGQAWVNLHEPSSMGATVVPIEASRLDRRFEG